MDDLSRGLLVSQLLEGLLAAKQKLRDLSSKLIRVPFPQLILLYLFLYVAGLCFRWCELDLGSSLLCDMPDVVREADLELPVASKLQFAQVRSPVCLDALRLLELLAVEGSSELYTLTARQINCDVDG